MNKTQKPLQIEMVLFVSFAPKSKIFVLDIPVQTVHLIPVQTVQVIPI
jgi:hypothetical protein